MIYKVILITLTLICTFTTAISQWSKIPGPVLKTKSSETETTFHVPEKTTNNNYIYALTGRYKNGKIYRSSNLGKNWEPIFSDDSLSKLVEVEYSGDKEGLSLSDLIVINDDSLYCYKASALAFSYNSGKTWNYRKTPNFKNSVKQRDIQPIWNIFPDFGLFSDGTFIGMTKKGELFKSTSNGKYWSPLILPDSFYKEACDLNEGKLIVSGNKCLIYFPLNGNSRDVSNNFYYLSEDNGKSFVKYSFPREFSSIEDNRYRPELKFYPLGLLKDGVQVWYKGGERGGGYGYHSENGLWSSKITPEHSIVWKTKDSTGESELSNYSMIYTILVQCLLYGEKIDSKFLMPFDGHLYCYDKIDKELDYLEDMEKNNFDKSFLINDPSFPNNQKGERSCNNSILCSSFYFWSPAIDQERMLKSISNLNDNTVQKQKEREKIEQQIAKKLKSLEDWIKTTGSTTIFEYFYDGLKFKVQKVELVGQDKIRVKIVQAELFSNNKPTLYQGVKLIQGADFVISIADLASMNK
jgi:hypothetical protein